LFEQGQCTKRLPLLIRDDADALAFERFQTARVRLRDFDAARRIVARVRLAGFSAIRVLAGLLEPFVYTPGTCTASLVSALNCVITCQLPIARECLPSPRHASTLRFRT
jgi:hypothetical protein